MTNELWIPDEYVEIQELKKRDVPNENGLRIYCRQFPEVYRVQIRTHKSITGHNPGKPRDMIAGIDLTREQLHQICTFVDKFGVDNDLT